jgi:oxygen-independent coproporphyrinogen-3 oxidase
MILDENRLPIGRGYRPTPHQRLIREMILQLKKGYLQIDYFRNKFQVDILGLWESQWNAYASEGYVVLPPDSKSADAMIRLTTDGLLCVDGLLPAFFEPQFRNIRYT